MRTWLTLAAALFVGCSMNFEEPAEGNDPRLLDRACGHNLCTLSGAAVLTQGITSDSKGIRLGPDRGEASIELVLEPSSTIGPELAILASGTGTFYNGNQALSAQESFEWIDVTARPTTDGVLLELSVRDGSTLEVVDIRSAKYDWTNHGCSVARSAFGRRR